MKTWERIVSWVGLALLGLLPLSARAQTTNQPETSRFLRFVQTSESEGHVDTAAVAYTRSDGTRVDLIGAVHIADRAYYESLNRRFTNYDVVLYEMVKPKDVQLTRETRSDSPVSALQVGMKRMLGLEFQLDVIDYTATNFVHADMDPEMFFKAQEANGESLFGLILRAALVEQARQTKAQDPTQGLQLLFALFSKDSDYRLKLLLARQIDMLEGMLTGLDQGAGAKGSVLVSGRNQVAMNVLAEQTKSGKRKVAIFYGAGHMNDFEKRLEEAGYRKTSEEWVTAWDIRKPMP